ncbi:SCO-spondin-like [Mytilus trossulus]|uniref:SCO-spondin-like n=1 Tax=Mytilus trossulus TaxID=6551 RepID=UPI003004FD74
MKSQLLFLCLAVVCFTYRTSAYDSCKDIYMADNRNSNGNYVIHHNGNAINVYCSFESNYGYTYISKASHSSTVDMSLLFTTRDFAKIRLRRSNGEQREVIVENLSSFKSSSTLYFGYNAHTSYQGPDSRNSALKPYLFLGFLPESLVRNYGTQGFRAAGKDFTFSNCDANPNSYISFYYNPNSASPGRLGDSNSFMTGWIDSSTVLSANKHMDTDFYFDWEMHMGGCGGFMTSHYLSNSRAALGLPFSIQPCDGVICQNGGSCVASGSSGTCSCTGNYFGDRCENLNGGWTDWSSWEICSVECGGGTQSSGRTCTNPQPVGTGVACSGLSTQSRSCNTDPCPVNGVWSDWDAFGTCSVSCGGGIQYSSRHCNNPEPEHGGLDCIGEDSKSQSCNMQGCPVDGRWTEWSAWSDCPVTCSGEDLIRSRSCTNPSPENNGKECEGSQTEVMSCYTAKCPVNGEWTSWTSWSNCPETCNDETLNRTRSCTNPEPDNNGNDCEGVDIEFITCLTAKCPVNGDWINWSEWSDCPVTCSGEDLIRSRSCTNPSPENNGKQCEGSNSDVMSCYTAKCPVNGQWSTWNSWTNCPETCNDEYLNRTRSCSNPAPENDGTDCHGNDTEFMSCHTAKCPVNGGWTDWSVWSDCPETCGDEDLTRSRSCTNPSPENNGKSCEGSNSDTMSCYTAKCPVDGNWTNWTPWTECPETCKDENLNRTRICSNPIPENNGNECMGNDTDFMSCQAAKCPVNGEWSSWSSWTDCPDSCDGEILSRERNCTNPVPTNGGRYCIGNETDTASCEAVGCPTKGEISQDMGSGFTQIRLNWSLIGILTVVIAVLRRFSYI